VYADQEEWTRRSIVYTAGSGKFSSDRTIVEYAKVRGGGRAWLVGLWWEGCGDAVLRGRDICTEGATTENL
jgi:hypothetical protein